MPIQDIRVISVPVGDPARAKRFYAEQLGFTLVRDGTFGRGMRLVQLRPPGGGTAITLVTWFASMPAGSLRGTVLACDDVERTARELTSRGATLQDGGKVQEAPWGRWVTLDDPDGNGWIVQEDSPHF